MATDWIILVMKMLYIFFSKLGDNSSIKDGKIFFDTLPSKKIIMIYSYFAFFASLNTIQNS